MAKDPKTGSLAPFDFSSVEESIPELTKFGYDIDAEQFNPAIDSSDIHPGFWKDIADIIPAKKIYYYYR